MAQKDYVKRPQAKKTSPKRNARSTRKSAGNGVDVTSWLKIFIAVAAIAIFVIGLYRLSGIDIGGNQNSATSQIDENNVDAAQNKLEVIIEQPPAALEELPELPVLGEEEWAYIDSLPDYSVEIDATGPLERGKDFIMQCGSFRTIDRAESLRAKIAFQGLESQILTSDGRNGLWYRVVLGPFERKRLAERYRHQLRSANINGCKIW